MFIDFQPLSPQATNDALEFIYKSNATGDGGAGIWKPHDSVLIRRLIELFTARGLNRLEQVKAELLAWEKGENHKPAPAPVAAPGMMQRWSESELSLVKLYLQSLPPGTWTLKDHMMAVDFVVQRYLPQDELKTEAEWLASRAVLMGKVKANYDASKINPKQADKLLQALEPGSAPASAQQQAAADYAEVHAAEYVQALGDKARHQLREVVMNNLQPGVTGGTAAPLPSLESQLHDQFSDLNRDWRRIAVTEAGESHLQGFIASLAPGTKVQRVEVYETACAFCKKIHGKVYTVVPADAPNKDGETQVWPGKSNYGRSASPKKRVGDQLVEREASELYWAPAGLAHPHCRGDWVVVSLPAALPEGHSAEFADELDAILNG